MQILLPLVSFITLCSVLVRGQPVAKTAPDTVWLFKRNDSTVATALNTTLVAALNSNQNNPEAGDLPLPATTAADICAPVLLNEPAAFMSNGKVDPFFNAINPAKALGQTKFAFFGRFVAVGNQVYACKNGQWTQHHAYSNVFTAPTKAECNAKTATVSQQGKYDWKTPSQAVDPNAKLTGTKHPDIVNLAKSTTLPWMPHWCLDGDKVEFAAQPFNPNVNHVANHSSTAVPEVLVAPAWYSKGGIVAVMRTNTIGGVPSGSCDANDKSLKYVPYSAIYNFVKGA